MKKRTKQSIKPENNSWPASVMIQQVHGLKIERHTNHQSFHSLHFLLTSTKLSVSKFTSTSPSVYLKPTYHTQFTVRCQTNLTLHLKIIQRSPSDNRLQSLRKRKMTYISSCTPRCKRLVVWNIVVPTRSVAYTEYASPKWRLCTIFTRSVHRIVVFVRQEGTRQIVE